MLGKKNLLHDIDLTKADGFRKAELKMLGIADDKICDDLRPQHPMPMSEWAEKYRTVAGGQYSGKWNNSQSPHLVPVMDAISSGEYASVVIKAATQSGKTETLINAAFYFMSNRPSDIIYVLPRNDDIEDFKTSRMPAEAKASLGVRGRISFELNKRNDNQTKNMRSHNNGKYYLRLVLGSSAKALSQWSSRVVILDEVDKFDRNTGGEGDPLSQSRARGENWVLPTMIMSSSPTTPWDETNQSGGLIDQAYAQTDMRQYECPCPKCKKYTYWRFKHIKWCKKKIGKDSHKHLPETAYIECPHCKGKITDAQRLLAIDKGKYVSTNPTPKDDTAIGFWWGRLQTKFSSIEDVARKFLEAKSDVEKLRAFFNQTMAETYTEPVSQEITIETESKDDSKKLYMDPDIIYMTLVADCKKEEIYTLLVGHGLDDRKFVLRQETIKGDIHDLKTWIRFTEMREKIIKRKGMIDLKIRGVAIDLGYGATSISNYFFSGKKISTGKYQKIILTKGSSSFTAPAIGPRAIMFKDPTKQKNKKVKQTAFYYIGTQAIKDHVALSLTRKPDEPNGYTFDRSIKTEFFEGLTRAEQKVKRKHKGGFIAVWEHTRPNIPNEPLDCLVYTNYLVSHLNFTQKSLLKFAPEQAVLSETGEGIDTDDE